MSEVVLIDRQGAIVQLTLNRPEVYNALNIDTAQALTRALQDFGADPAVHGIIITGAGKAFSAGGDIKFVLGHQHGPAAAFHELATHVHVCVTEIRRLRKPVIAAINGVAAGGGFSLALACDFRVMAASAQLKQGFTSNALCMDGGGTFHLPRLVGLARALEISAFDEPISAEQALAWGLVTRVAAAEQLLETARAMAETLAQKSLHTFGQVKTLLTDAFDTSLETQLERERRGLAACAGHADGLEGMHAFIEKRPPRYNRQ
ncbi:MAG: enoyl-CoA hydratase/isomerase family protein [Gammaproteobacteria bacterium]|nr:enoyl-CoA hydratase/isomerase family protein [Gammaproteobacteria bacterium]MCP5458281.1 enoyl-CoA hydratase/isomerase family protein [Gammaproteobacteria bacterium]